MIRLYGNFKGNFRDSAATEVNQGSCIYRNQNFLILDARRILPLTFIVYVYLFFHLLFRILVSVPVIKLLQFAGLRKIAF